MKVTVLGGAGGYPTAHQGCSGFLLEHDGFRLVVDPGYATIQRLLTLVGADEVDAVWVSHGHPDHCADLQPLLRARALRMPPATAPLPVYAPLGSLAPLLALDQPDTVDRAYVLHDIADGDMFDIGPLHCAARDLPHMVPNLGIRITADAATTNAATTNAATTPAALAYTGDCGPSPAVAELAAGADLLIANATFPESVAEPRTAFLSSARQAGTYAQNAGAKALMLTHLWPGSDPDAAFAAAAETYDGPVEVASPGLIMVL
jgi:ribonuclease BN (tRNA processing enzyme)